MLDEDAVSAPFQIAVVYALRKEPDKMFEWLERAYTEHDPGLTQLLATPFILDFKDDPRFAAFCQKLKVQFPPPAGAGQAMSDRTSFFNELKRRNVIRATGLYLVGAWLLGFIPTLIVSWVHELTQKDSSAMKRHHLSSRSRRKDRMIIVVLVLAYFCIDKFILTPRREAALVAATEKSVAGTRAGLPLCARWAWPTIN